MDKLDYGAFTCKLVQTEEDLKELESVVFSSRMVCLDYETTTTDIVPEEGKPAVVGINIGACNLDQEKFPPKITDLRFFYIPLDHEVFTAEMRMDLTGEMVPQYWFKEKDARNFPNVPLVWGFIKRLVSTKGDLPILLAHNAKFEMGVTRLWTNSLGWSVKTVDTMVTSWLLDANRSSNSLKNLARELFGYEQLEFSSLVKQAIDFWAQKKVPQEMASDVKNNFRLIPLEQMFEYGKDDVFVPFFIFIAELPELMSTGLFNTYMEVDANLLPIISSMEFNGTQVDYDRLSELSDRALSRINEIDEGLHELCGEVFNAGSTEQVSRVLFTVLRAPVHFEWRAGKKGFYSTAKDVLGLLAEHTKVAISASDVFTGKYVTGKGGRIDKEIIKEYEYKPVPERVNLFCSLLLERRNLVTLRGTFLEGLKSRVSKTNTVHSSFLSTGSVTGRFSSSDPNLENIPGRNDDLSVRRAFLSMPASDLCAVLSDAGFSSAKNFRGKREELFYQAAYDVGLVDFEFEPFLNGMLDGMTHLPTLCYPGDVEARKFQSALGKDALEKLLDRFHSVSVDFLLSLPSEYLSRLFFFVSVDYSQIELRLLAHYAEGGSGEMSDAFHKGEDVHARTCDRINSALKDSGLDAGVTRREAKFGNFGLPYGMGLPKFCKTYNLPPDIGEVLYKGYFLAFPKIRKYQDRSKKKARELGYAETIFGRRRMLPDCALKVGQDADEREIFDIYRRRGEAERRAVNFPIQGSAADLIKQAMVQLKKAAEERSWWDSLYVILNQVHDELLIRVHGPIVREASALTQEIMESAVKISVPVVAEPKICISWDVK